MELTIISLFAGGGGSSLGYKWAGFKELLAIEWDKNAVETFKLNFSKIPIWQKDIKKVKTKDILNFCNIEKGQLDILDGSPPCQGFSIAGKRQINDNRNDLFKEYIRLIKGLQPKVFIMENVSGMAKGKMKGYFIEIITELKKLNYNVKCKQMNTKYYNVPQSRERLIFIGVRKDLKIKPSFPKGNNKIITVKEAWKNLSKQEKQEKELDISQFALFEKIKKLKQGECLTKYYNYGFNTARLSWNKPSKTITRRMEHISSCNGLIHPEKHRKLTLTELKKLSTFPDNFKFINWKSGWHIIGNSVPPLFMKVIAKHVKIEILEKYYNSCQS